MKYRVIKDGNCYFVQFKFFFWWVYVGTVCFGSLEAASNAVKKLEAYDKNIDRIIQTHT